MDDPSVELVRLAGETRATEAARARAKERSLRQQANASSTLTGILVDLAEQGCELTIRTRSGRAHHGQAIVIGQDFVTIRGTATGTTLIAVRALATVRRRVGTSGVEPGPKAGGDDPSGDRPAPSGLTLAAYLGDLAPERPRVGIVAEGEPSVLYGHLRSAGRDVMTLRLDGEPPVDAYVSLDSLSEVTVLG